MAHAHLPIDGPSLDIVLRDLSDRGLADTGRLGAMMTEGGMWASRTTELGNDLLGFVRDV
jgi:hypothetical protein